MVHNCNVRYSLLRESGVLSPLPRQWKIVLMYMQAIRCPFVSLEVPRRTAAADAVTNLFEARAKLDVVAPRRAFVAHHGGDGHHGAVVEGGAGRGDTRSRGEPRGAI